MTAVRLRLEDVEQARRTIAPHLRPTPLRRSFSLRGRGDCRLKLECWQPTGSFKVRGALNVMASLSPDEQERGVVAASAGNHALGVAFAAQALGGRMRATLFVPESAPRAKVDKLRSFPVEVRQEGADYDRAAERALEHARRTGATNVHAFADRRTAAGQGTIGLEILEEWPDVRAIVVPVGGGGLIAGIATAVKARSPETRIIAVQPEASPSLRESLRLGRALTEYPAGPTLADGIAGGIGEIAFDHRDLIDEVVIVPEAAIEDAMVALLAEDQVVAEASGAIGVAAVRAGLVDAGRGCAIVITGANVDASVLARLLAART
ncbi:MAG TPA: threonine/serine dehydratase [Vicinamibacteria bacterium]|nr:threonine/serine dehydratase [Vicinamibacteria bacterium]